MREKIAD